jgi:hypothetical protein
MHATIFVVHPDTRMNTNLKASDINLNRLEQAAQ